MSIYANSLGWAARRKVCCHTTMSSSQEAIVRCHQSATEARIQCQGELGQSRDRCSSGRRRDEEREVMMESLGGRLS